MANDALIIYLYFPPPPNFLVEWEGGRKRNKCMEVMKSYERKSMTREESAGSIIYNNFD